MAPVSTSFSSYYPTPTAFLTEAVYAGAAMIDDLSPSPVSSIIHHTPIAADPGLHQFIIYMVILAAIFFLYCAYILGKSYIGKCCGTDDDDDDDNDEKRPIPAREAFRPPTIALPAPSATFNRSDPWLSHRQMGPVYISQMDMLSSSRGFFG